MVVYFQEYQLPLVESYATHTYLHMRGLGNLWWQFPRAMLLHYQQKCDFVHVILKKTFFNIFDFSCVFMPLRKVTDWKRRGYVEQTRNQTINLLIAIAE